jgi:hypothetical protein
MRSEPVRTLPLFGSQAASAAPEAGQTGTAADARNQSFRPVEGGGERRSGEVLLIEAYAVIWAIAFVFILIAWRRQRRIDERVNALEAAIAKASRGSGKGTS